MVIANFGWRTPNNLCSPCASHHLQLIISASHTAYFYILHTCSIAHASWITSFLLILLLHCAISYLFTFRHVLFSFECSEYLAVRSLCILLMNAIHSQHTHIRVVRVGSHAKVSVIPHPRIRNIVATGL